mgnify:CR=1 FL=1
MADAKVIPFDDDRSRGAAQRSGRRGPRTTPGTPDRPADRRTTRDPGSTPDDGNAPDDAPGERDLPSSRDPQGVRGKGARRTGAARTRGAADATRTELDGTGTDSGEASAPGPDGPAAPPADDVGAARGGVTSLPEQQALRRPGTRRAPGGAAGEGTARPRRPRLGAPRGPGRAARRPQRTGQPTTAPDTASGDPRGADGTEAEGATPQSAAAASRPSGAVRRPRRAGGTRTSGAGPGGGVRAGDGGSDGARRAATDRDGGSSDPSDQAEKDRDGASGDGPSEAARVWERRLASGLAFLRRRLTGEYEVDDFGYDAELTDQVLMSLLRPVFEKYFRVEVRGVENIPAEGGALIVANHSGTLPLDGLMMQVAVHDHHPAGRHLRLLAADLVFMLPVVNELARKAGHTLACTADAERLLGRGELVGVMPEGFKGVGKPFSERYKLQRFGRGGFVSTALRAGVPIVPCSVVGAEEIYPMIGNAKTLARLLGLPYFPITPTFPWLGPLGALPLPTKWTIQFGEPIETGDHPPEAADDPVLMFNLTDQVREEIQHTLYRLLVQRRSVFF